MKCLFYLAVGKPRIDTPGPDCENGREEDSLIGGGGRCRNTGVMEHWL